MDGEGEAAAYDEIDRIWGDIILQGFAESAAMLGVVEGRVLDVGTGSGRIAIRLAKLNSALAINAIDLSPSMLKLATANAASAGVRNITFSIGDAKHIPFDDQTFDLVVCHQLLHQLPDPVVALREINRVAKRSGAMLVRDVRRLPEPMMTIALPFWCLGYNEKLREQTRGSFRAGLTKHEYQELARDAGVERATIRTHFLTHQSIERVATPYRPFASDRMPGYPVSVRVMKSFYVSRPQLSPPRP